MGGVAAKCTEMTGGNAETVDAKKAVEEEEEAEEEEVEEEEDEGNDAEEAAKNEAQEALQNGLVRGKTTAFREAIDHATSLGIDEDIIHKAEAALEEHKKAREKEIFTEELATFLEADDLTMDDCEAKKAKGEELGVGESVLQPLLAKMQVILLSRALEEEELERVAQLTAAAARRFVASCLKGRSTTFVSVDDGKKSKAVCRLDPALRKLSVSEEGGTGQLIGAIMLKEAKACSGAEHEDVKESSGLAKLKDEEQDCTLALFDESGNGPWLLMEPSLDLQAEFLLALAVLGSGNGGSKLASTQSMRTNPAINSSAGGGGAGEGEGDAENPDGAAEEEKKDKKDKKEKKEKKEKKAK